MHMHTFAVTLNTKHMQMTFNLNRSTAFFPGFCFRTTCHFIGKMYICVTRSYHYFTCRLFCSHKHFDVLYIYIYTNTYNELFAHLNNTQGFCLTCFYGKHAHVRHRKQCQIHMPKASGNVPQGVLISRKCISYKHCFWTGLRLFELILQSDVTFNQSESLQNKTRYKRPL